MFNLQSEYWEDWVRPQTANLTYKLRFRTARLLRVCDRPELAATWKISNSDLICEGIAIMPRAKGKKNDTSGNTGNNNRFGDSTREWRWVNTSLSPDDVSNLERLDTSLEELAPRLIELACDGYGISIKHSDRGETVNAVLIRPDNPDDSFTLALSCFASNVRDAVVGLLYKFDVIYSGEFPSVDGLDFNKRSRFR